LAKATLLTDNIKNRAKPIYFLIEILLK